MATAKKTKKFKAGKKGIAAKMPVTTSTFKEAGAGQSKRISQSFTDNWKVKATIFFLLVTATAIFYKGDLHLGFFSIDDEGYVTKNPWIKKINFDNLSYILTTPYFSNFSPMHLLSYMLDYAIGGLDAFTYHLSSNLWAGLVAGFVYLVAQALTGRQIVAVASALLFVVHPSHVEAIAWISSRKDLVATAFALPSLLAYLQYRKGGPSAKKWYALSLFLFLLAVAGKVSVATFPAVFFAIDLFVEKRSFKRSIIDKIPFAIITVIIAALVYMAQPQSGNRFDPYVFLVTLGQSLWLLSGFGKYVIYRLRPETAGTGFEIASILFLLILFAAPLLLRRRFPKVVVLYYWMLLGLIPAQLLSFVHPVSDRYLFFPSVAVVILIGWGIVSLSDRLGRKGFIASLASLFLVIFFWGRSALNYLAEWRDPRSVWYASMEKSTDPDIPYSLGGYYLTIAGQLGASPQGEPPSKVEAKRIASAIWSNDPRLPKLLAEWERNQKNGPIERDFQNYLWDQAWNNFEKSLATRGTHVLPLLYFRRGVLLLNRGNFQGARKEFLAALEESSISSVKDLREEVTVSSHNALGVIAWKSGDYREALKWYKTAEEEQTRFGGNWVPDISERRKQMEATVGMLAGSGGKTDDPEIAYNMGLHYLNAADQLGTAPSIKPFSREGLEGLANEVWPDNPGLKTLLSEWEKSNHGSAIEVEFQKYLRKLAWDAFENAVRVKGNRTMPYLYFRRGMILGQTGDLKGARKEFMAALDEASRSTDLKGQQEFTVDSHDALGVIAWTGGDYKEALHWFKLAEEEQARFGGNWVPDITSKRQRMETMVNSKTGK